MATTEQHLAPLADAERARLESLLADFDRAWDENLLARKARQLPAGDRLRVPALIEMIRIDLERRWQRGRRVLLEAYLKAYPEVASADGPPAVLLRAEFDVRCRFGARPSPSELLRRFPGQEAVTRQLGAPSAAGQAGPVARETVHSHASVRTVGAGSAAGRSLPEQFGKRYRIIKRLGRGGMGTVFLAQDTQLDRPVAVKVPHFTPDDGPDVLKRFHQEARIAATLDHPNICPIYDVGEIDGVPYLTMKCILGKPLSDSIRPEQPLPPAQAAALVRQVALALQEAHGRGIIHRDLKPSNILIERNGAPVVMDFGLAARPYREGSVRLTQAGMPLGTPAYMAPEQVRGETQALGPACDVYSLGVILYELLTGHPLFEGASLAEVFGKVLYAEPPPPSQLRPGLDRELEAICRKAMAKNSADRYATMGQFADALAAYLRRQGGAKEARPNLGLGIVLGIAAGLVAVLVVLAGVVLLRPGHGPANRIEPDRRVAGTPPPQPSTPAPAVSPAPQPPAPAPPEAPAPVAESANPAPPARPAATPAPLSLEKCLPDDTVLVVTVNVRQVLDSAVVRKHFAGRLEKLLKTGRFARAAWNAMNFDPLRDVSSLRIAVSDLTTPSPRMVFTVQGHFDRARLEAVWAVGGKLHEVPNGAGGVFRIYESGEGAPRQPYFYATLGESAFVAATDRGPVVEVLTKAAGRRSTAVKDEGLRAVLSRADERAGLWLAAGGNLTSEGQTLREALGCESLAAAVTVADDLRAEMTCRAADPDAADRMSREMASELVKASVQLSLEAEKDPELTALLDILKDVKAVVDGNTVTVKGRLPAEVLDRVLAARDLDDLFQKAADEFVRLQAPAEEARRAVEFNNALVAAQNKVAAAAEKVVKALEKAATPDDLAHVRTASAEFLKTVAQVQSEVNDLTAPPGPSAVAFRDALGRLLRGQAHALRDDLGEILRIIENPQLRPAAKETKIKEIQSRMGRNEQADLRAFQEAQKAFAADHKIVPR
jgi:hypothetical protein